MEHKKTYLCLHGHFYQPPRENPWIEEIETQENVGDGYHDWNERISWECYRPNALARILDAKQSIEDIVNNFSLISFNIGPTLLSWLEKYDHRAYERILEADGDSVRAHHGHGNAVAQVYNHIIMPLANRRDKFTQVKWGIEDFKKRFNRQPESLWLSETACDEETLEVLIEAGMKFLILSPYQAESVRDIGGSHWRDVRSGNIDPTQPYRYFLKDNSEKYIDVFFYDGPISKAVAFDDLLFDAKIYANRLESAKDHHHKHSELIHVATDGETYGHHKTYGDRVLAYLLKVEAPNRGFTITNYGEYLENFPPQQEVKINFGADNQGTSWSCQHGVKRWLEHCGCRGGGEGHWRQDWRKPLRQTFDWLRDELAKVFESKGSEYFHDVWEARNDYIQVVLDRGLEARKEFFKKHAKRILSHEEVVICMKLLEMQRNCMLMYTSCGWFFTEISGEETVQVIKYAARALQLAQGIVNIDLTPGFVQRLSLAKSNIEYFKNGLGIYEYLVRPSVFTLEKVVSHFAISSLFKPHSDKFKIYCYEFNNIHVRKEQLEDLTLCVGHVKVRSTITLEEIDAVYVLLQSELYDFYCYVKPFADIPNYQDLSEQIFSEFTQGHRNKMGKIIYDYFGKEYYSLKDLFKEEKSRILELLSRSGSDRFKDLCEEIYQKHRRMIDVYRMAKIPLPEEYRFIVEHKLSDDFNQLVIENIFTDSDAFDKAHTIRIWAKEAGLKLYRNPSEKFLTKRLNQHMEDLCSRWDDEKVKDACRIGRMCEKLGIEIDKRMAQENYLVIVQQLEVGGLYLTSVSGVGILNFIELGGFLAVNIDKIKPNLEKLIMNPI